MHTRESVNCWPTPFGSVSMCLLLLLLPNSWTIWTLNNKQRQRLRTTVVFSDDPHKHNSFSGIWMDNKICWCSPIKRFRPNSICTSICSTTEVSLLYLWRWPIQLSTEMLLYVFQYRRSARQAYRHAHGELASNNIYIEIGSGRRWEVCKPQKMSGVHNIHRYHANGPLATYSWPEVHCKQLLLCFWVEVTPIRKSTPLVPLISGSEERERETSRAEAAVTIAFHCHVHFGV